jgi:hypothetical protein
MSMSIQRDIKKISAIKNPLLAVDWMVVRHLWNVLYYVKAEITNIADFQGAYVGELYIDYPMITQLHILRVKALLQSPTGKDSRVSK